MKLMSKIKALFTMKGKQQELELTSAEVRQNGVYLHPTEDPKHTYFIKTDEVDIIIKPGAEIRKDDFYILDHTVNADPVETSQANIAAEEPAPEYETTFEEFPDKEVPTVEKEVPKRVLIHEPVNEYVVGNGWKKPKKKSFTVMLYPDEYDKLSQLIKDSGYKKVEYILACVESAKKTSMEANCKRFTEERERRRKEEAQEAKKAREAKQAKDEEVDK